MYDLLFISVTSEEQPILPKVGILGSVTAVAFINFLAVLYSLSGYLDASLPSCSL